LSYHISRGVHLERKIYIKNIPNNQIIDEFKNLKTKLETIKNMGWVKSLSNGTGAGGITLELLLGKERENFEIPDYNGIEIKTSTQRGYKISLFNSAPDNELFEIKRILEKYGCIGKNDMKYLNLHISSKKETIINDYLFKLKVDYQEENIKLFIFNENNELIDHVSWSFEMLKEKLIRKLSYLAFVHVLKKDDGYQTYYKYFKFAFYQLESFEKFLWLIDNNYIAININVCEKINIHGEKYVYDHGTSFELKKYDISKLFKKIDI
jgi:hypothetical protein